MKKVWLISSIGLVAILLVVGNMLFKERVEKTSGDDLSEVHEDETVTVDANGNVVTVDENGNPITVDENGDPLVQGNLSSDGHSDGTVYAASKALDAQLSSGSSRQGGDGLQAEEGAGNSSSATANQGQGSSQSTSSGTSSEPVRNGSQSGSGTSQQKSSGETESVTSIKNRYFPQFQQLEWEQNGKLEGLIQRAFDDYMTDQEAFNSSKYRSEAQAMQASADSAFYGKYGKMQDELAANGHSRQAAADFEQSYQSKKTARERELRALVEGF